MATAAESSLDVDWLLHSKKDHAQSAGERTGQKQDSQPSTQPPAESATPKPRPAQKPAKESQPVTQQQQPPTVTVNGKDNSLQSMAEKIVGSSHPPRPPLARGTSTEDSKKPSKPSTANKKDGRRSSWIANISSKFSSSNSPVPPRNASPDLQFQANQGSSPQPSPKVELSNPFNKKEGPKDAPKEPKKEENKQNVATSTPQRRPSVLVAAGKETKLDHPGFLSSALRRLSSTTNTTMGKGAGSGAVCPRRVMNLDHNRERIKIGEFEQNKLKRVAFCVDVEIAGFASQADEDPEQFARPPVSGAQKQIISAPEKQSNRTKDSKDAKVKEKGEGAALKNPKSAVEEKEEVDKPAAESTAPPSSEAKDDKAPNEAETQRSEPQPIPTTRKKEKKKRSEAERLERRERKRKHAEANGLVPLELTRDDDDSDSSPNGTPPGSSTPRRPADGPTTDPLRIYKRCCQLRETSILSRVKEQISKPSATLAEAPGTVAVMDLSGLHMQLQDVVTLGDWLAIVPVRKLVLDNCGLTDEAVRVILSGLSGCKSIEQVRQNRKLPKRTSGKHGVEQMGVVEKLSLKGNSAITHLGWKHIGLFLHMSRSLRGIDLSGIQFPKPSELSRTLSTTSSTSSGGNESGGKTSDLGALIIRALSERLGDKLEELILSGCGLLPSHIQDFVDCAIKRKLLRLGLADNNLNEESLHHVVRYLKSGVCEGLDLGGNDLHGLGHILAEAADEKCPLFAISLCDCQLTPDDLSSILIPFAKLHNLKFIDLSRNMALFSSKPSAVPVFRKLLPKLQPLKRLHLTDVGMTSDQVIALAEILPDCPSLAHLSILDNAPLVHAMNSKEESSQEEACAFFASLMTAVRVSETINAVEIEVPSSDSSEVVKALASQVVAYSLRNMERTTLNEVGVKPAAFSDKDTPDVLLHLVGHMEGYPTLENGDEPAPDKDYVIASTGIVKALDVCLGSKDGNSQGQSRSITPVPSGTSTPRSPIHAQSFSKPKDVSRELCESARKIRTRLRPVLIKEDRAGNDANYRRLLFLDQTLQRMIQRFEDEYPETKATETSLPVPNGMPSPNPSMEGTSVVSDSVDSNGLQKMTSADEYFPPDAETRDAMALKLSRTPSNTSLAAKAFTDEEGRMHRFGQSIRREVLKPTGIEDRLHGSNWDDTDPPHLAALRSKLEAMQSSEFRLRVEEEGVDKVVREIGLNAKELLMLREQDPEGFETFRNSQLAAQINAGLIAPDGTPKERT